MYFTQEHYKMCVIFPVGRHLCRQSDGLKPDESPQKQALTLCFKWQSYKAVNSALL